MRFNIRKSGVGFVTALVGSLALSPVGAWAEPTPTYLDNRSTPQSLVASYYNAINQKQYARAYGYFSHGVGPKAFQPWAAGYETTQHVAVKMGETYPDPGAGQVHWALPVALSVVATDGQRTVYAGCYHLSMTSASMQIEPPFVPLSIQSATLQKSSLAFAEAVPSSC